jgi:hypothetical protein
VEGEGGAEGCLEKAVKNSIKAIKEGGAMYSAEEATQKLGLEWYGVTSGSGERNRRAEGLFS